MQWSCGKDSPRCVVVQPGVSLWGRPLVIDEVGDVDCSGTLWGCCMLVHDYGRGCNVAPFRCEPFFVVAACVRACSRSLMTPPGRTWAAGSRRTRRRESRIGKELGWTTLTKDPVSVVSPAWLCVCVAQQLSCVSALFPLPHRPRCRVVCRNRYNTTTGESSWTAPEEQAPVEEEDPSAALWDLEV